jgi:predicted nucleic acid-binding protein
MSKVYWDSMLFMYALERNPLYFPIVQTVLREMHRRADTLCTSIFTLGEVLVGPRKLGSISGADRVKAYFAGGTLEVLPYTLASSEQFASIRAWTSVKPADAIHLATASLACVDVFLTNDIKLLSLKVPGIRSFANLDPQMLKQVFT